MEDRSISVRGIIIHKNLLLVEWWSKSEVCFPPGGRILEGENLEEALSRELKEELGVEIAPPAMYLGTILSRWQEDSKIHEVNNHFFKIPWPFGIDEITSLEEGRDFRWIGFKSKEFPKLVPPSLRKLVPELNAGCFRISWNSVDDDA